MVTKAWRIYGAKGHRQRASFGETIVAKVSNSGHKSTTVEVINSDITGTNEYSLLIIIGEDELCCDKEMEAQIYDGAFENCTVGNIELVSVYRKEG